MAGADTLGSGTVPALAKDRGSNLTQDLGGGIGGVNIGKEMGEGHLEMNRTAAEVGSFQSKTTQDKLQRQSQVTRFLLNQQFPPPPSGRLSRRSSGRAFMADCLDHEALRCAQLLMSGESMQRARDFTGLLKSRNWVSGSGEI